MHGVIRQMKAGITVAQRRVDSMVKCMTGVLLVLKTTGSTASVRNYLKVASQSQENRADLTIHVVITGMITLGAIQRATGTTAALAVAENITPTATSVQLGIRMPHVAVPNISQTNCSSFVLHLSCAYERLHFY